MTADGHIKADRGSHEWCWTCMVEWPCPATKEATLQAELVRLREQADALAAAAEGIVRAVDAHHPKFAHGPFTLTGEEIDACRAALRAFREAVQ